MKNNMEKEQKCKVCGRPLSEEELFESTIKYHQNGCPDCAEILNLQKLAIEHWDKFKQAEMNNPIEDKNYSEEEPIVASDGSAITVKTLGAYSTSYEVEGRTNFVENVIKEIDVARRFLYQDIGPYFEILESMFNKNYRFWKDGGNLWLYVKNAIVSYIVIHLKEYLDNSKHNKSKHSIYRFINIIQNNNEKLFKKQKIFCVKSFKKSKDVMKTLFECFPIEEYLNRLDVLLQKYKSIIETIDDYRNNVYAHSGTLKKKEESENQFTLINLRKIFNSLKIVYDCLSYSIAPDKFAHLNYDYNIWYDHLNTISQFYETKVAKPQEEKANLKKKGSKT